MDIKDEKKIPISAAPPNQVTSPEQIVSITWDNFSVLQPEWLEDENILYQLKLFVQDISDSGDASDASQAFVLLHQLLQKLPLLVQNHPDVYREYLRLLTVLKACFLSLMPDGDIHNFLRDELTLSLEVQDFDIKDKLNDLLLVYRQFPDVQANFAQELLKPIEENQEYLGTDPIVIRGHDDEQLPRIANWLVDYTQFVVSKTKLGASVVRAGGLERATYLSQSPNSRRLTEDERDILKRLLELHDWLKAFVPVPQASEATAALPNYITTQREKISVPPPPRPVQQRPQAPVYRAPAIPPQPAAPQPRVTPSLVVPRTQVPPAQPRPSVLPPAPKPAATSVRPSMTFAPTPPQAAAPSPAPQSSANEDLYRSTLEELAKMRQKEAAQTPGRSVSASPKPSGPTIVPLSAGPGRPAASVAQGPMRPMKPMEPFSVNEALVHGDLNPDLNDRGEMVSGDKDDVAKKLKDLEDRVK